jgi:hypothetical protein
MDPSATYNEIHGPSIIYLLHASMTYSTDLISFTSIMCASPLIQDVCEELIRKELT